MAKRPLPDQATLLKLLRYEPETGRLFWRERPVDTFNETEARTAADTCKKWNAKFACKEAFVTDAGHGYRKGSIGNVRYYAHRIIWRMMTGADPDFIDHINGERADNRWCNLRAVTKTENCRNMARQTRNVSGCLGVMWNPNKRRWAARITVSGKVHSLGYFRDIEAAIRARKAAERKFGFHPNHGARLSRRQTETDCSAPLSRSS